MREILFRGKRLANKKWVEGYLFIQFNTLTGKDDYYIRCGDTDYLVIPETVGQYTGLTDKNGNKIFEGDIVKIMYLFGWDSEQEKYVPEEEYISKVYSIDACPFCVDLQQCDSDMTPIAWLDWAYDDVEIEIIGNIHDNPELLGGEP